MINVRILHINKDDPWVTGDHLIEYFNCQTPALKVTQRVVFANALSLIQKNNWEIVKTNETEEGLSLIFKENI